MDTNESQDAEPSHTFDWTGSDTASTAVVVAVAAAADEDPTTMEPLYGTLDPDALNDLFDRPDAPRARVDGRVTFEYHGFRVVLEATGRGSLHELEGREEPTTDARLLDAESTGVSR